MMMEIYEVVSGIYYEMVQLAVYLVTGLDSQDLHFWEVSKYAHYTDNAKMIINLAILFVVLYTVSCIRRSILASD